MTAKGLRNVAGIACAVILVTVLGCFAGLVARYKQSPSPLAGHIGKIDIVSYETENGAGEITLPGKLENLPPRSSVTLYAEIEAGRRASLLFKSVFAPARVYLMRYYFLSADSRAAIRLI